MRASVERVLTSAYGLVNSRLTPVSGGLSTVNFAVDHDGGRVFVKTYPPGTDLAGERAAIDVARFVHAGGIATPEAVADGHGEFLHVGFGVAVSVWSFVEGRSGADVALDGPELEGAGALLGRMHRRLALWPGPATRSGGAWCALPRRAEAMADMKVRIRHAGQLSRAVRVRAGEVLRWREQRLGAVDAILRGMPVAAVQVLHGDCTERNFMFRDGQGPIVVDFRAPLRWPVWWEVARFGCAVPAVLAGAVHISRLARLVVAYRQHNAEIPVDNLTAVAQAARCYMTASVTPFQDLVAPGPVMSVADLEGYVETRHAAVVALWDRASDYDEALREALR